MKYLILISCLLVPVSVVAEEQPTETTQQVDPTVQFALDKVDKYFEAVTKVVAEYGDDAVDLGLTALRIDAASRLVAPVLRTIIFSIVLIVFIKLFKWSKSIEDKFDREPVQAVFGIIIAGAGIAIVISAAHIFDVWAITGIFYPEVYAVHKFLM